MWAVFLAISDGKLNMEKNELNSVFLTTINIGTDISRMGEFSIAGYTPALLQQGLSQRELVRPLSRSLGDLLPWHTNLGLLVETTHMSYGQYSWLITINRG